MKVKIYKTTKCPACDTLKMALTANEKDLELIEWINIEEGIEKPEWVKGVPAVDVIHVQDVVQN